MARGTILVKNLGKCPTKRVCIARVDPSTGVEDDCGAIEPGSVRSYNSAQLYPGEYRVEVDFADGGRSVSCVTVADDAETVAEAKPDAAPRASHGVAKPMAARKAPAKKKAKKR